MTASGTDNPVGTFDVGVAIVAAERNAVSPSDRDDHADASLPGYDEAFGLKQAADRGAAVVVTGGEAVRVATEAIAGQIGLAAQRIATAIEAKGLAAPGPGQLSLESVEVSFGITLTAGVQALFTAQAESSAQVNITLTRRPAASS